MDAPSSGNRFPSPARRASALLALLLGLCLQACIVGGEKHAGVDEFPNSVYARVSGFLDEGKKSGELGVPDLGDSLQTSGGFIVAAAKLAVAKQAASGLPAAHALAKAAAGCS